jgi:selenocysteine-specific elongation factor
MPNESEIRHFILATAGHVDHGKTALVRALTGVDTDRLPEEKARGITIELGFAHLELPGFSIGVIDVPGHEDFVRNMIAGVGAIDLALLVVAADDGWMPQTEEHLQILDYLGVTRGVVALTKSDLGNVETRSAEIRHRLNDSVLANAPIVTTSVRNNTGIEELRTALRNEFAQLPPPRDFGKPRLFVDRVFTIHGSGTVVTGSLSGGTFARGENVRVQPQNLLTRIRGLQSHNQTLDVATPRRRLALNLADLGPDQLSRGSTICAVHSANVSRVLDVALSRSSRLSSDTRPIRNGAVLNLHFGSARIVTRMQLRDAGGEFLPNEDTIARLRLREPVCALIGDRFILRDSSERLTIAGGTVLDATPGGIKFRSSKQRALLDERAIAPNDLGVLLRTKLRRDQFVNRDDLSANIPFSQSEVRKVVEELGRRGEIFLDERIAADADWWKSLRRLAAERIENEHVQHPERRGLEVNRLQEALDLKNTDVFAALIRVLTRDGYRQEGTTVRRVDFRPSLPPNLQAAGARICAAIAARPFDPPSRKELAPDTAAIQALRFLCETGELVAVSQDLVLSSEAIAKVRAAVELRLTTRGEATVSELRQATTTTRRVIVPLLEYFDRVGLTKRTGDRRTLR